jgi:hypothetical protein
MPSKRGRKHREHLIVQHHYHDHASDPSPTGRELQATLDESSQTSTNNNSNTAFPLKLYEMLSTIEQDGFSHIVSWQPHGRCFVVHKPDEFKDILPRYFKLSKVASFQRQLNLYGFTRLTRGNDKGGYYNELFLRGKLFLVHRIQRVKVKGTGVRAKSNPAQEPNFWKMPWVSASGETTDAPPAEDIVTTSTTTTLIKSQETFNGASSVVSHDEEEQQEDQDTMLPSTTTAEEEEEEQEISSSSFAPRNVSFEMEVEPEEDSLIFSWGMPFHYLPHHPPKDLVASVPTLVLSNLQDDQDMKKVFADLDFDQIMRDLIDNARGESFAQLLDRAIE